MGMVGYSTIIEGDCLSTYTKRMDNQQKHQTANAWSNKYGDGYPALADFIAQDPDHETFVFRRFKALGARNILNLQGELIKLEDDVAALEQEAADNVDPELHLSMRSWTVLNKNSRKSGHDLERKQKELAYALEQKLKKYCQCLPKSRHTRHRS